VLQVHGVDAVGAVVIRRILTGWRVLAFFEKLSRKWIIYAVKPN